MALTAKDIKEFEQLRQQLQPVLSSTKNQLLQRIKGEIGAVIKTGSKPPKLTKKQLQEQWYREFL